MKNKVYFDLDGVLCDYVGSLEQYIKKTTCFKSAILPRDAYDVVPGSGFTREAMDGFIDGHYKSGALMTAPFMDDRWADVINALDGEFEVAILTARPFALYENLKDETEYWAYRMAGIMTSVKVIGSGISKDVWIEKNSGLLRSVLIEDNLSTVERVNKLMMHRAFLVPRLYNATDDNSIVKVEPDYEQLRAKLIDFFG